MKRWSAVLLVAWATSAPAGWFGGVAGGPAVRVPRATLEGAIEGENIAFTLDLDLDVGERGIEVPLVVGDVSWLGGELPGGVELRREAGAYHAKMNRTGRRSLSFRFAARPQKDGEWRNVRFQIPSATVRRLAVACDRADLDVQFPGALDTQRGQQPDGQTLVTATLGPAADFQVRWKPEVRRLDGELVVSVEAAMLATAGTGVLRLDALLTYRVAQGRLSRLALDVPAGLTVTQVQGADIQDWRIEAVDGGGDRLQVTLGRPAESEYRLRVEGERILPAFPATLSLPVLQPRDVLRASGFLMLGTDNVIKLVVRSASGVTQIDPAAFPAEPRGMEARPRPARNVFAYQYASLPYTLELEADDIVPEVGVNADLVLRVGDNDLALLATVELDVRDAEARDVRLAVDPEWTVATVRGEAVADYDVRDADGARTVQVHFQRGVLGRTVLDVRLERTLADAAEHFRAPLFRVEGARTERGHLVLAAEKGLRVTAGAVAGLREVRTGSTPVQVEGAQQAFRFKEPGWSLEADIARTAPSVHAELFHLLSIGEGVAYGASTLTFHISGAPVRVFRVRVPAQYPNVEFIGRDVRNFVAGDDDIWSVYLQEKVLGDYTLLVTYNQPFAYAGEELHAGGIAVPGVETEVGYLALASSASLQLEERARDVEGLVPVEADEIPREYTLLINDPVLRAYKYTRSPHGVRLYVHRFETEALLNHVIDRASLVTRISRDGEAVTTATYFIKNASRQHLAIRLPRGAKLWTARAADEQGTLAEVRPSETGDGLLVPLRRLRDPNLPVKVELQYAEGFRKPRWYGRTFVLRAPRTPETHTVSALWHVTAPEGQVVRSAGGNLTAELPPAPRGLSAVVDRCLRALRVVPMGRSGARALSWGGAGLAVAAALAFGLGWSRGRPWVWGLGGAVLLALAGLAWQPGVETARRVWQVVVRRPGDTPTQVRYVKLASLAAGEDMEARLAVAPRAFGAGGSPRGLALSVLAGVAALALGRRGRSPWVAAAGVAVFGVAVAQLYVGRVALSLAVLGALSLLLAVLVWRLLRRARGSGARLGERRRAARAAMPPPSPLPPLDEPFGPPDGVAGHVRLGVLLHVVAVAVAALALLGRAEDVAPPAAPPAATGLLFEDVAFDIDVPDGEPESVGRPYGATFSAELRFASEGAESFPLLGGGAVLTDIDTGGVGLRVDPGDGAYRVAVTRGGTYRLRVRGLLPVRGDAGRRELALSLPASLRNRVQLVLPQEELDVTCDEAVWFQAAARGGRTEVEAVIGAAPQARFVWRPRARKTQLEKAAYLADVTSLARLDPGVVDFVHLVRFQIAQGELSEVSLELPAGMTVTSVQAPRLSTWRFDPERRRLDAVLDAPVSGDLLLVVSAQIACEGLPYSVEVGVPTVLGATRQRGSVGLASPESVQLQVESVEGVSAMNTADLGGDAAARLALPNRAEAALRRAFRYQDPPALLRLSAARVLPDLRVVEKSTLSIEDERIWLSSQFDLAIARAGIFSLRLLVPPGYDLEALAGPDVSHWDEQKGTAGTEILVHFQRQVMGERRLAVDISATGRPVEARIEAPRVGVPDARKLEGTLVVSGERGIRLTPLDADREGVSDLNPRTDLGRREPGLLAFRLLRPGWRVVLGADVQQPVVRPEVLQQVRVVDGMLGMQFVVQYRIEHAGVKTFRLRAPAPDAALSVAGKGIAKVSEVAGDPGLWQVDLHAKQEEQYRLDVRCQVPFRTEDGRVTIRPLRCEATEAQSGYVAVYAGDRLQVQAAGAAPEGLKVEDARSIPGAFRAAELSDAILCYRAVAPDYALDLDVVRHRSADVLPAQVRQLRLTTILSEGGRVLTAAELRLRVGHLRFLEVTLPHPRDAIWTCFVNDKVARPARAPDGRGYRIPLDPADGEAETVVKLLYAGSGGAKQGLWRARAFVAPKFGLPLQDIVWTLHAPPGLRYFGFAGDFAFVERTDPTQVFDERSYLRSAEAYADLNRRRAREDMQQSLQLASAGQQKLAKKALEQAMQVAPGEADREDARIQYRNLVKQQAVVGLVQRRNTMRMEQNIQTDDQVAQMRGFNEGQYTAAYAQEIAQSLSSKDNEALQALADRFLDQQTAAAAVAQAIEVALPGEGVRLTFRRPVQIDWAADLSLRLRSAPDASPRGWTGLVLFAALAGLARAGQRRD